MYERLCPMEFDIFGGEKSCIQSDKDWMIEGGRLTNRHSLTIQSPEDRTKSHLTNP